MGFKLQPSTQSRIERRLKGALVKPKPPLITANQRHQMRGPTGKLIQSLRELETKVSRLNGQARKGAAVATFFAAQSFGLPAYAGMVYSSFKGAQARSMLLDYIGKNKNRPRVALYLAEHTTNNALRQAFTRYAIQEIRFRKILRSEKTSARFEYNLLNGNKKERSINEAYEWGVKNGLIKERAVDKK